MPSAAQSSVNTLNTVDCMPAMPPIPTYNRSQEHVRSSPNPFVTGLNCTNPFTERTVCAGNLFKTETQEPKVTSQLRIEGSATYNSFPSLNAPSHSKGKPVCSVSTFEDDFFLQSKPSLGKNTNSKGWVTFEEEEDFSVKMKSFKCVTELKRVGSKKPAGFPDLLGTEQNTFLGSDFTFDNNWNKSSTDSFYMMPARRPLAPPIPSRITSNRSPVNPFVSLAPKGLPAQDFTER